MPHEMHDNKDKERQSYPCMEIDKRVSKGIQLASISEPISPWQDDPGDQTGETQEDEADKENEVEKPKPKSFALGPQPFAFLLLN